MVGQFLGDQIDNPRIYVANDGTEVSDDEYFGTLDAQTLFVIATNSDHVKTGKTLLQKTNNTYYEHNIFSDFELMCETIESSVSLIEQGKIIRSFLNENAAKHSISKLLTLERKLESQATDSLLLASSRKEHPEWFIGEIIL